MNTPRCDHAPTVRISSHMDMLKAKGPTASMYSCDREACQEKIKFWVQGKTGRRAIVVPLPK